MKDQLKFRFFELVRDLISLEDSVSVDNLYDKVREIYDCVTVLKFLEQQGVVDLKTTNQPEQISKGYNPPIPKDNVPFHKVETALPEPQKTTYSVDTHEEIEEVPMFVERQSEVKKEQASPLSPHLGVQIPLADQEDIIQHLFGGKKQEYIRVISQLNSFKTSKEAINFFELIVRPDYKFWSGKEQYEALLVKAIKSRFV